MKRKSLALILCMALLSGCAAIGRATTIVTSFYPMYIFTQNVAAGIEGITVVNMADQNVGCLHDYQLQTRDMVTLERADVFVINGGGMEQFMEKVASQYSALPVVNASEGIDMLCSGHEHDAHGEHAHEGEMLNAHVWLDPRLAAQQVINIGEGLAIADPANADAYRANAAAYSEEILAVGMEIGAMLAPYTGSRIVTFHEAFDYFALAYGIEIAGVIQSEAGEEPATREIASMCDLVKGQGITALFVEPQYPQRAAETIARETGAVIYMLDPMVTGDGAMDSYERTMLSNAAVLMEALNR